MTHNLFEQPNDFDTDIDTLLDDAYAENLAAGRVMSNEFANQVATDALHTQLDAMQDKSETSAKSLTVHEINDKEIRGQFFWAFTHAREALTYNGEKPPNPKEFHDLAGIDFGRLAATYKDMQEHNLDPQIVIAPHMQPIEYWQGALAEARARTAYLHPNIVRSKALFVWDDVAARWSDVNRLPQQTPNFRNWTIRIAPGVGAEAPSDKYTRCLTASEYLAIQAVRFRFNKPLLNEVNDGAGPRTIFQINNLDAPAVCGRAGSVSRQIEVGNAGSDNCMLHVPQW